MKKRIIFIAILPVAAMIFVAVYISLPWIYMYLVGKFCVPEPEKPLIMEESFPFTLIYELNGKEIVIEDKMICKYMGSEWLGDPDGKIRTWGMELESGGDSIVLWQGENSEGEKQRIIGGVAPEYYMDDVNDDDEYKLPDQEEILYPGMTAKEYYYSYIILETTDSDGVISGEGIGKTKLLSKYGIKILSWKCRQPIKNSFIE